MKLLVIFCFFLFSFGAICQEIQTSDSLILFHQVHIKGNDKTHGRIIMRELSLKEGSYYTPMQLQEMMEKDRQKIFNLNLFIHVKLSLVNRVGNQTDMLIELKERWYYIVLPTFRLADRSFNEWWYERNRDFKRTIYGVYFDNNNFTGNGDRLRFKFEAGFIPYYELSYNSRYIDKKQRIGMLMGVYYSTQRSLPYRTWNDKLDFLVSENISRYKKGAFITFNYRKNFYHTHTLQLGYEHLKAADTLLRLNPKYFSNQKNTQAIFYADYGYLYDNRDNQQYTLKGNVLYFSMSQLGLTKHDDIHQTTFSGILSKYFSLGKRFYTNINLRYKISFSNQIAYPTTLKMGYRNDLVRGYELYVIDGQAYGILKTNLKYQLIKKTFNLHKFIKIKQFNSLPMAVYLNTFADVGYMKNKYPELSNTFFGNRAIWGGGVGLDFVSWYDFVGTVNYSINQFNEKRFYLSVNRYF